MNILTTILKTPQYSQALLYTVIVLIVAIIGIFIPLRWRVDSDYAVFLPHVWNSQNPPMVIRGRTRLETFSCF